MAKFPSLRIRGISIRRRHGKRTEEGMGGESAPPAEERKALIFRSYKDFREIESYPLYEPWAYARILQHKVTGEILYYIDEIPLTPREKETYKQIMDILYWELEPPPSDEEVISYFTAQAKRIVKTFQIRMGRTPGISWGKILYYVLRDSVGFGPIDPLMRDPFVEDISCSGVRKPVYVWHSRYEYIPSSLVFQDEDELDNLVVKLAHMAGKHISVAFPVVDAILPGGHRLAATYRREVSTSGSSFTIRKFREEPLTIVDLLDFGTLSPRLAAYYWVLMEHKRPGMVMGVTGSGKTTTLNALLTMLKPSVKVVTIEDTPELRLPLENWVQLTPRMSYGLSGERIGEITLFDLVKISLRYRPDIIVVGEVRGEEAYVLFQAMATGHGGMTTLHAENIDAAVKRLTSPPMNIPRGYVPLMNFAVLIRRVEIIDRRTGKSIVTRRITNTWEIADYNNYIEVHKWNPREDEHEVNLKASRLLGLIAELRGWDMDKVMEELDRRTIIMEWMKLKRLRSYKEVAQIIREYYLDPDRIYRKVVTELKLKPIQ